VTSHWSLILQEAYVSNCNGKAEMRHQEVFFLYALKIREVAYNWTTVLVVCTFFSVVITKYEHVLMIIYVKK